MSTWSDALQVLADAEAKLRELIERSLGQRKYDEVTNIARLADAVAQVASLNGAEVRSPVSEVRDEVPKSTSPTRKPRQGVASRSAGFPRFERNGDWLIKIGWSKRERSEYEHRAPRHVVHVLLAAIRAVRGEGSLFSAAEILPLKEAPRREVPSYQAYLALAWLRREGIIVKKGRDRYTLKPAAATPARLAELWDALPERR